MQLPALISHVSRKVLLAGIAGLLIPAASGWALWSQGGFTLSGAGLLPTRPVLGMVAVDDWFGLLYVEPTRDRKDPTHVRFAGIRP